VIPLAIAWIGDVVAYERRQALLADMQGAEHEERGTPADQLAEKATRRLAEDDAEDLTGDVACPSS
jgi:hypothetical protein